MDYDDDVCACGHERWEHSLMATMFVDVGCTHIVPPPGPGSMRPHECHCAKYVRAAQRDSAKS